MLFIKCSKVTIGEFRNCTNAEAPEVFRLPQHRLVRICRRQRVAKRSRHDGADLMSWKRSTRGYVNDFVEFISSDRKNNPGFQSIRTDLIHRP